MSSRSRERGERLPGPTLAALWLATLQSEQVPTLALLVRDDRAVINTAP